MGNASSVTITLALVAAAVLFLAWVAWENTRDDRRNRKGRQ